MVVDLEGHKLALFDACCVINLYATQRIEEILHSLPLRFAIAERVANEALYVRRSSTDDDADEQEMIDLQSLVASRQVELLRLELTDEMSAFVDFASDLDDGEAMTCALAICRGAGIATDDRKARRLLQARAPHVQVYTTTELIKWWAELERIDHRTLKRVLTDVRERGRFVPGKHDPLHTWWVSVLHS